MLNNWDKEIDMMVSVKETHESPYFTLYEENSKELLVKCKSSNCKRRQDLPKVYALNGSFYLYNVKSIKRKKISGLNKIKKYLIEDPIFSIDIDTNFDWLVAETVIKNKLI